PRRQVWLQRLAARRVAPDAATGYGDHQVASLPVTDVRRADARSRRDVSNDTPAVIRRNDELRPGAVDPRDHAAVGAGDAGTDGQAVQVRPGRAPAVASGAGGPPQRGPTGPR